MATKSWNEMKRVREDEYFKKQENAQKQKMQTSLLKLEARLHQTEEKMNSFTKGPSPITGAPLFKAHIAGHTVLDCPADDMILVSQATLLSLIESLQNGDKQAIAAWKAFLKNQSPDE